MKISYSSSLWSEDSKPYGLAQSVNWAFECAGTNRIIPFIYRFSKGIVFDIITCLDEGKLRKFYDKYESIEDLLSPLQQLCAEQEHPYQAINIKEIWLNGKKVMHGYSSSSAIYAPWAQQGETLLPVKKAYAPLLADTECFACERFCIPYPETNSKTERFLRFLRLNKINRIKLSTLPVQQFYPLAIHFVMSEKENHKEISFQHPVTGLTHMLYFQNAEFLEMPMCMDKKRNFYTTQSVYEIDPALPEGDILQFNNTVSSTERIDQTQLTDDILQLNNNTPHFEQPEAASIGIIGGADGPTSIFVASQSKDKNQPRPGIHGLPLHNCLSIPSFQKNEASHFSIDGIQVKIIDGMEYNF